MTFTVQEFHDLITLLEQQPAWREELRRLLLTDELLELPQIVRQLVEAQRHTETTVQRLVVQVGGLRGAEIERRYRERAPAYFAPFVRRIHALSVEEVAALLDELEARTPLDARDRAEILDTDLVVRGRRPADGAEMYLAVEVSAGIGRYHVERACERAQVLQRVTGKPAMGVVAGETITREGEDAVQRLHAWQVLDGRTSAPA
jgi:hypothetical protein